MDKGYLLAIVFGVALIGFLSSQDAYAVTITAHPVGGDWNSPFTWIGEAVPGPADDKVIPLGATVTISSAVENSGTITIQNSATMVINSAGFGTIFTNPGTINNSGTIVISNSVDFGIGLASRGIINNSGTITISNSGQSSFGLFTAVFPTLPGNLGTVNNYGTINVNNSGAGSSGIKNPGTINNFGTINNSGRIDSDITVPGILNQHCGATYSGNSPIFFGITYLCPVLQFSSPAYLVAENGGSAIITVIRTGGSAGIATVQYATSDGTATLSVDYTASSGILTFNDGVTSQTFSVPILTDSLSEGDETVSLKLSAPTGSGTLTSPSYMEIGRASCRERV